MPCTSSDAATRLTGGNEMILVTGSPDFGKPRGQVASEATVTFRKFLIAGLHEPFVLPRDELQRYLRILQKVRIGGIDHADGFAEKIDKVHAIHIVRNHPAAELHRLAPELVGDAASLPQSLSVPHVLEESISHDDARQLCNGLLQFVNLHENRSVNLIRPVVDSQTNVDRATDWHVRAKHKQLYPSARRQKRAHSGNSELLRRVCDRRKEDYGVGKTLDARLLELIQLF